MTKQSKRLPSTATGRRRLLKLADLLEADAKNKKGLRFNMGTWGYVYSGKPAMSCNTEGCAMAVAVLSGKFKRAGLSYRVRDGMFDIRMHRKFGTIDAASDLFDLTDDEAMWLFLPSYYSCYPVVGASGERSVAKRIRDFVAGRANP